MLSPWRPPAGLILCLRPANYFVTTSPIGWTQAQNQPCPISPMMTNPRIVVMPILLTRAIEVCRNDNSGVVYVYKVGIMTTLGRVSFRGISKVKLGLYMSKYFHIRWYKKNPPNCCQVSFFPSRWFLETLSEMRKLFPCMTIWTLTFISSKHISEISLFWHRKPIPIS